MSRVKRGRPAKDFSTFDDMLAYLPILVEVWEADGNVTEAARKLGHKGTKSIYHARMQLRKNVNEDRSENDPLYDRIFFFDDKAGETRWTEKGIEFVREGKNLLAARKRVINNRRKQRYREEHHKICKTPIYRHGKILLGGFSRPLKSNIELVYMCKNCSLILYVLKTLEFIQWRNLHPNLFIGNTPAFLEVKDPNLKLI